MKKLSTFLLKPLVRKSILSILVVVGVFMVRIPVEVSANTCTQYLYPCPSTISVWGGNVLNYYGGTDSAALGTLPNGHPYCGYFAQYGDPFTGAYDRVTGQQITFVRALSCGASYDTTYTCGDGSTCYQTVYPCNYVSGTYVAINPINQGTKCQGMTAPSDQPGWPNSKYWLEHDCSSSGNSEASSWTSWYGYDTTGGTGGYACYGAPGAGNAVNCGPAGISQSATGSGTNICVNVGFQ